MFSLSEITSLFDLSRYFDRSFRLSKISAKVLSQKVKLSTVLSLLLVSTAAVVISSMVFEMLCTVLSVLNSVYVRCLNLLHVYSVCSICS